MSQAQFSGPISSELPPLPEGTMPPTTVSVPDAISRTLSAIPPAELLEVMKQLKVVATSNPEQAKNLLTASPQLAYAVFQAMLMMGLVDPTVLQTMVASIGGGASEAANQAMHGELPQMSVRIGHRSRG